MARARRNALTAEAWQALPGIELFSASNWFTLAGSNKSEFFVRSRRLTTAEWYTLKERYRPAIQDLLTHCRRHGEGGKHLTMVNIRSWAEARQIPLSDTGIDLSQLFDQDTPA